MLLWQVLRSCSSWSAGQDLTEYSIQRALVATIEEAKHYVYIENQFFVSYVKGGSSREQPEQAEVFFKNQSCWNLGFGCGWSDESTEVRA